MPNILDAADLSRSSAEQKGSNFECYAYMPIVSRISPFVAKDGNRGAIAKTSCLNCHIVTPRGSRSHVHASYNIEILPPDLGNVLGASGAMRSFYIRAYGAVEVLVRGCNTNPSVNH